MPPRLSQSPRSRASISGRQAKACLNCRGTKIRCKMIRGIPPCDRCRSRGLDCQVERDARALLEEANRSRDVLAGRVSQLQTAVGVLLRTSNLPPLASYHGDETPAGHLSNSEDENGVYGGESSFPAAPVLTPVASEDDGTLYSLPINSLYEVTKLPWLRDSGTATSRESKASHDFISRELIAEDVAQQLFEHYTSRLDFFCYGIMCPHETLDDLRSSSTLLTAAVCVVAALHDPDGSDTFRICHSEFLRLLSAGMFALSHTSDDVRALIIGSYWLGNISYTLIGHAVRIAMRLNYHLAYFAAVRHRGGADVDQARLWYVLYIIDHHSSILYGRPALISAAEEPHRQWEAFIQAGGSCEVDLRMCSQVALYQIIAKVRDVFGTYATQAVPEYFVHQLRGHFAELDRWYMIWGDRMPKNAHVGWFPRDGAILHYHFARLHLCSHVFRGISVESAATASAQVREYANLAVASATSVLELLLERLDLREALVGMPIYFHGMMAFAAVFLIKAARTDFAGVTAVDAPRAVALVQRCARELRSQRAARQHLVYHISIGLEDVMEASKRLMDEREGRDTAAAQAAPEVPMMDSMFMMDTFDLFQGPLDALGATMSGQQNWMS